MAISRVSHEALFANEAVSELVRIVESLALLTRRAAAYAYKHMCANPRTALLEDLRVLKVLLLLLLLLLLKGLDKDVRALASRTGAQTSMGPPGRVMIWCKGEDHTAFAVGEDVVPGCGGTARSDGQLLYEISA